jgi:hypothetical protein
MENSKKPAVSIGECTCSWGKKLEEVRFGRVAGPFDLPPLPDFRCSPVGLVPKSEPGKFRFIHHLSWPRGASVNDGIGEEEARVSYTKFDTVVDKVMRLGHGALFAKADIQPFDNYRCIPKISTYWVSSSRENFITTCAFIYGSQIKLCEIRDPQSIS